MLTEVLKPCKFFAREILLPEVSWICTGAVYELARVGLLTAVATNPLRRRLPRLLPVCVLRKFNLRNSSYDCFLCAVVSPLQMVRCRCLWQTVHMTGRKMTSAWMLALELLRAGRVEETPGRLLNLQVLGGVSAFQGCSWYCT